MARPSKQALEHPELKRFGEVIRAVRLERGLSQEALADLAGLDRSYMGGVERGEHNIALINLLRIAKSLECSLEWLVKSARL